jgi:stage V sporulation protein B
MGNKSEHIRRDLTRGAAISFAGNGFKLAEFGLTLLAAGLFGVQAWGKYIFLTALFMPVVRLACAGLDKGVTWYVSRHRESGLPPGFHAWIRNRCLAGSLLLLAGLAGWRFFLSPVPAGGGTESLIDPIAAALMAVSVPFLVLTNINLGMSIAFRKIEHEVLIRGMAYPSFHLGLPCALHFLGGGVQLLAASWLAGNAAGWALSEWLARPLRRAMEANPVTDRTPTALRTLWSYSWPMGLRDVLLSIQQRTDVWCLALFLTPEAIGIYGLSLSIANSIRTIRQAFDNILLAVVASLKRRPDAIHIRDAYLHAGQATLALQIPIFAFLLFFSSHLLGLSGEAYRAGEIPLLIFAFTLIITGYLGLGGTVVLGLGKSRWGVFNDLLCLCLSLGFNFLLVPRYGITGAALGTSLAILLTNLVWFAETIYLIRLVPLNPAVIRNFLLGVGASAAAWGSWRAFGDPGLPSRSLHFGIFLLAYAPLLHVLFVKPWLARRRAS